MFVYIGCSLVNEKQKTRSHLDRDKYSTASPAKGALNSRCETPMTALAAMVLPVEGASHSTAKRAVVSRSVTVTFSAVGRRHNPSKSHLFQELIDTAKAR